MALDPTEAPAAPPPAQDDVVQAMLDDLAAGKAVPSFGRPSTGEPAPIRQRRQRSDAGQPRGPKNVGMLDGVGEALPVRRRGRAGQPSSAPLSKDDMARVIVMAHTLAETMVSKQAHIEKGDADKIADAMVPVLQDFGIVVVGKAVHLLALLAVVVTIEGPIVYNVMKEAQDNARAARATVVTTNIGGPPGAPTAPGTAAQANLTDIIGVAAGAPFTPVPTG